MTDDGSVARGCGGDRKRCVAAHSRDGGTEAWNTDASRSGSCPASDNSEIRRSIADTIEILIFLIPSWRRSTSTSSDWLLALYFNLRTLGRHAAI